MEAAYSSKILSTRMHVVTNVRNVSKSDINQMNSWAEG